MKHTVTVGLCLALLLTGCAHRNFPVVTRQYPFVEVRNPETERATMQLHAANVAIDYEDDRQLFLAVPPDFEHQIVANLPTLEEAVVQCTTNRELAVVTMGPATRSLPQTEFDIKVDEVERKLRWIGFHQVVFHLGSTMRPIYRE